VFRKAKQFLLHKWNPSRYCSATRTSCDMEILLDTSVCVYISINPLKNKWE
jgi:hypothetical protein